MQQKHDDSKAEAADAKRKKQQEKEAAWFELKNNTSVYVTGVPEDATVDEIAKEFERCGIIKLDDNKQPRIKIYRCGTHAPYEHFG